MASSIATKWSDLSGKKYWKDLLEPKVDDDLRRYLIHYGERAGAAGDLLNTTKASRRYVLPLFPPNDCFAKTGLEKGNPYKYDVTNYFYAAADAEHSEFFGYVAVATDDGKLALGRRDILVAWRGTATKPDEDVDKNLLPTSAKDLFGNDDVQVHSGFHAIYIGKASSSPYNRTSARDQVLKEVRKQVDAYQNEKEISITVVGFSLGAALATLCAADIVANGYNKPTNNPNKECMVTAFAYASPRVGNDGFKDLVDRLSDLRVFRVINSPDMVPKLPFGFGYTDVGQYLEMDSTKSPFLKKEAPSHNLEIYLHGVAGIHEDEEKLDVDHDFKLINKVSDALLDKYKIPNEWWNNEMFKNMVQLDTGHWQFDDSAYVPDPPAQ